jgi:hypothetical protein
MRPFLSRSLQITPGRFQHTDRDSGSEHDGDVPGDIPPGWAQSRTQAQAPEWRKSSMTRPHSEARPPSTAVYGDRRQARCRR